MLRRPSDMRQTASNCNYEIYQLYGVNRITGQQWLE